VFADSGSLQIGQGVRRFGVMGICLLTSPEGHDGIAATPDGLACSPQPIPGVTIPHIQRHSLAKALLCLVVLAARQVQHAQVVPDAGVARHELSSALKAGYGLVQFAPLVMEQAQLIVGARLLGMFLSSLAIGRDRLLDAALGRQASGSCDELLIRCRYAICHPW